MVEFSRAVPVLPVLDVAKSLDFYRDKLGFEILFAVGEPVTYAGIRRGDVELHLYACPDPEWPANAMCRIIVRNIDELYEEYQAAGVIHPNGHLQVKPWGSREFAILDPDTICITIVAARET